MTDPSLPLALLIAALMGSLAWPLASRGGVGRARRRVRVRPTDNAGSHGWSRRAVHWIEIRRSRRAPMVGTSAIELAAVLDNVARRCAAGDTLSAALVRTMDGSDRTHPLVPIARAISAGRTVHDALGIANDTPEVAYALHVLRLTANHGGNVGESLDRAATALRERHAIAQERVAQSAQARLSAQVLTLAPIAFAGWTVATSADVRSFAVTVPGAVAVVAGLALNIAGWRWMQRTIRGAS